MWHTQVVCIDKSNQLCSTVHCNDARSAHNIILSRSRMSHSQAILLLTANNNADLLHFALTLYVHSNNKRLLLVLNTDSDRVLIHPGSLDKTFDLILSFSLCIAASWGTSRVLLVCCHSITPTRASSAICFWILQFRSMHPLVTFSHLAPMVVFVQGLRI